MSKNLRYTIIAQCKNKKLEIIISASSDSGRVDIIGDISEWTPNNAIEFRQRCQEVKDSGAKNCHVYMMTNGGSCFQANEIVNILIEIFGSYTAEGGAIVASAGTYIAVCSTSFLFAKNGQFMIHKPMGGAYGNETEVENQLTLLKNMTTTYFDAYVAKLAKPEADFKAKWDGGDFWMTAQEGKDWGFITEVKEPVKIPKALADSIKASGSPLEFDITDIIISKPNTENEMNLQAMALALGLASTATEAEITAKLADNAEKAGKYDTLLAQTEQSNKEQRAATIKADLDKAILEKRITADNRASWRIQLLANYEGTKPLLDSLKPLVKASADMVVENGNGKIYQGKTFEQLQDEAPEMLAQLEDENPDAYKLLFADYKKRNKIK